MSVRILFFAGLLAAGLFGCGKQPEPRHIVILPDVSGSIDPKTLEQAFKAIDDLVGNLHRGDRIAIIPILGDAEAEASGRIIRFKVPTNRQAYDADLSSFRRRLGASLKEMQAEAVAHPGSKTDILGSVGLAGQEFQSVSAKSWRQLVILSDFIQEDREINFMKDQRLMNRTTAEHFVARTAAGNPIAFQHVRVYLGMMRSTEYTGLAQRRREAIREFWIEYFTSCGAEPRFANDGVGLIESSLVLQELSRVTY